MATLDDRAIWRMEQYEWKRKGIVKPTGCHNYYAGCQCSKCLEREAAEKLELAEGFAKPCPGCGIPAEFCDPETCELMKIIKKAAS